MSNIRAFLPRCHDPGEFFHLTPLKLLVITQLSPFAADTEQLLGTLCDDS